MGLLLCKRKLRAAAFLEASSSKTGTVSFAQLAFVKSYSMESILDIRAFISLVRGAGKIPKSMLDNAALEEIYKSELLSKCKAGESAATLGLVKEWIIEGQDNTMHASRNADPSTPRQLSQRNAKRPSKLTPPTVRKQSFARQNRY